MESLVPNFPYVFTGRIPVVTNSRFSPESGPSGFGWAVAEAYASKGSWQTICMEDSDLDGNTNGMEMGDPCCTWTPGTAPYRRWDILHPARPEERFKDFSDVSPDCDASEPEQQKMHMRQYEEFYWRNTPDFERDGGIKPAPPLSQPFEFMAWYSRRDELWYAKLPFLCMVAALMLDWLLKRGLCRDLVGVGPAAVEGEELDLPRRSRALVFVAAYYYHDFISATTHVAFDFMPRYTPFFGALATGFQFHHVQPRAWVEQHIAIMISHSFIMLGVLSMVLYVIKPRRIVRLFWAGLYGLTLLVVFTHRWAHIKSEELPLWWRALQNAGIIMTNERHMHHHHELTQQFGQLSGISDIVVDPLCRYLVAPHRFEFWTSVMLLMYVAPAFLGSEVFWQRVSNKVKADDDDDVYVQSA